MSKIAYCSAKQPAITVVFMVFLIGLYYGKYGIMPHGNHLPRAMQHCSIDPVLA
ncbi:MAG TPA: hypothetical protein VF144_19215 [Chitinophagaceae bacterium]